MWTLTFLNNIKSTSNLPDLKKKIFESLKVTLQIAEFCKAYFPEKINYKHIFSITLYYQGEPMSKNMYEKESKSEI